MKEAVFNILQFDVEGRRVLDLFAGTGQLGIEALSRGAASAVFVDRDRRALKLVQENLELCSLKGELRQEDAISALRRGERYDLIFVDPPYDAGLYEDVLDTIKSVDNLSEGGIIICEARRERELPDMEAPFRKKKESFYGSVKIAVYVRES